jgi:hypothetical protein
MKEDSNNKQSFIPHALSRKVQGTRLIYIAHLTNQPISEDEKQTLLWVSTHLGENAWKDGLIIFINAHTLKPIWNLASVLKKRSDMLRLAIATSAGWDIASSIVTIVIDGRENPLTDARKWLEKYTTLSSAYHLILEGTSEAILLSVVPQQQCSPEKTWTVLSIFPCNPKILACFYLLGVPLSAVGLFIGGIVGYEIAILSNILLWIVVSVLRIFCRKHY